jgi:ATP/maltotriose-dependent transcriptional regulator MalT/DNA-binding SARP family transcriptional activator
MIESLSRTYTATHSLEGRGRISRPRLAPELRRALGRGHLILTAGAGCGKTTLLDEALRGVARIGWISCSEPERTPGILLMRLVEAVASAVPGGSDAVGERLTSAPEQVDALAATRELLAELSRLLVEPLSLVLDDAEHLDGAEGALELLDELLRADARMLHAAVATRRALDLRVAKPRAVGRLTEFTAADLAFDAKECADLLRARTGRDPSPELVDDLMEATEGWPLGVALAARLVERSPSDAAGELALRSLQSASDLRSYLSEELLDSLEPGLREAAITSSVTRVVTTRVGEALDLPDDLASRVEHAGLLVRRTNGKEPGFSYHPLLRDFMVERLRDERGEEERRRLNAAVAPAVAEGGDAIGAIEHWLDAERWSEAMTAIQRQGTALVATSPDLVRRWLARLPPTIRDDPAVQTMAGQLEWIAGDHPRAAQLLRSAVRGFRGRSDAPGEWWARFLLVDSLFFSGEVEDALELARGWDAPGATAAGILAPATAIYVATFCLASVGRFEESDRLAADVNRHPEAAQLAALDAIRRAFHHTARGELDQAYEGMETAAQELERSDPFNRRMYLLASMALLLGERGRFDDAVAVWTRVREEARGGRAPYLADTARAECAALHARAGRLRNAETELAGYEGRERGWRAYTGQVAAARVASLRGDAESAITYAERALALVSDAPPVLFRWWVAADVVQILASAGGANRASEVLADAFELIDESLPGPNGRFPRSRLLALRAWLEYTAGRPQASEAALRLLWRTAGGVLPDTLRREWGKLEPVLWGALERGVLDPEAGIGAVAHAFPDGLRLVPFLDHPVAGVRRVAIGPALASGHPDAVRALERLAEDPDASVAAAARAARRSLRGTGPPLSYRILGGFSVRRGAWSIEESGFERPLAARLVRLLLLHHDRAVPADLLFEALWEGRLARRALEVAVSRARAVLDLPGSEHSAIEASGDGYVLRLGDRDTIDAEEFEAAAVAGLRERGRKRRALLERARSLWAGEPLPADRYADWATGFRERVTDRYLELLAALAELYQAAGEDRAAIEVGRELVALEPLDESAHRGLISSYARAGRTGYALRQYLECRRALVTGLGIEPSQETSRLQSRILAGEPI